MSGRTKYWVVFAALCAGLWALACGDRTALAPSDSVVETVGPMPPVAVAVGGEAVVEAADYFRYPNGDAVTYAARTGQGGVAEVTVEGGTVRVRGLREGTAEVTVTARSATGATGEMTFSAHVASSGICNRTAAVRDAILSKLGVTDCAAVGSAALAGIDSLDINIFADTLKVGDFAWLTGLRYLDLSFNELETLPVGVFSGLTALEELDLGANDLTTLPTGVFSGLTALESLWLHYNDLTTLPAGVFSGLTALRGLYLYVNDLTTLPAGVFSGLTALEWLGLQLNDLTALPAGVLGDLTALKGIYLGDNALTALPAGVFDGLTALEEINLSRNALTALPAGVFSGLTALEELWLFGNDLAALPDGVFSGLTALESLWLYDNDLTILPVGVFSGLTALESLRLSENDLAALPDGVFSGLTALESLRLYDNDLAILPVGVFSGLTALKQLYLFYNDLTILPDSAFYGATGIEIASTDSIGLRLSLKRLDSPGLSDPSPATLQLEVPEATPADLQIELSVAGATITSVGGSGGAISSVTIPRGSIVSPQFVVTKAPSQDTAYFSALPPDLPDRRSPTSPIIAFSDLYVQALDSVRLFGQGVTPPGISVDPDTVEVDEGGTATFTVVLESAPSAAVTVTPSSAEMAAATVSGALTFTAANWNAPQTVTVTGAHDDDAADETTAITLTATGGDYGGTTATATVVVADDDAVSIVLDPAQLAIEEGDTATVEFTAKLATLPSGTVTVSMSSDNTDVEASPGTLTFTSTNWDSAQAVVVSANHDADAADETATITLTATGGGYGGISASVAVTVEDDDAVGICDRTAAVRDSIMSKLGVTDCTAVGNAALAGIDSLTIEVDTLTVGDFAWLTGLAGLDLSGNGLTTLPDDLFSGLTALEVLLLNHNELTALPSDVFDGLTALETLSLSQNDLTTLPAGVFSGLTALRSLYLEYNTLTILPAGVFSGLTALQWLYLGGNALTTLPAGVFNGLTALEWLDLSGNGLTTLPVGVFDDLTAVRMLSLSRSALTTLPAGVFSGLTGLKSLHLHKAFALTTLPAGVFSGLTALESLNLSENALTLPVGVFDDLTELEWLNLSRSNLTLLAGVFSSLTSLTQLSLDRGALTTLPAGVFSGLAALRTLRLEFNDLTSLPAGVFNGLTALKSLYLFENDLTTLPAGVFDGLTALELVDLHHNALATLPTGVFIGLTSLEWLNLRGNALVTLPAGVFNGLTALKSLYLFDNALTTLPAGAFSGSTALEGISLSGNALTTLPVSVFSGLTRLKYISLDNNALAVLPAGVFSGLAALEGLRLKRNALTTLPSGVFSDLTALERLYLDDNALATLPAGVFGGLAALDSIWFHNNDLITLPDSAFHGTYGIEVARTDSVGLRLFLQRLDQPSSDAPSPARVRLEVPEGAPADLQVGISAAGGTITSVGGSGGTISSVTIPRGAIASPEFLVTLGASEDTVYLSALPPDLPDANFGDLYVEVLDSVRLFGQTVVTPPGIEVDPDTVEVDEGGTATFTVVLESEPDDTVTVTPSSTDTLAATTSGALAFTVANWSIPQTVAVAGVQDGDQADETATITLSATGGGYDGVLATVTVDVDDDDVPSTPPPNQPPVPVGTIPPDTVDAGDTLTLNVAPYFSDPDGDELTYSATNSDSTVLTVSVTDSALTVVGVAAGADTVTVTATDPGGLSAEQRFEVTVPNQPPDTVGAIPPDTVTVGGTLTVNVAAYFSDPDGDALTYSATNPDATVLTVTVADSVLTVLGVAAGADSVTVTATDPDGLSAEQRFEVRVEAVIPPPPNQPPVPVGTIPADTVGVGDTLTVNVAPYFSDPDGDELTYSATSSDATVLTVTVADSVLTVAGLADGVGVVTVTAKDGPHTSAPQVFEVTVGAGLALPVVSLSVVSGSVAEGDTARLAVVASPAPSSELRVSYHLRADTVAGTADADSLDVAEWSGEVVFGAGTVTAFAEIAVVDDAVAEPTREVFVVELTAPAPGAGYRLGGATSGAVTILEGVCDRTPVVRDGIVWEASASDCAAVDDAILGEIDDLNLDDKAISALRAGDFAGLSALEDLHLRQNALDSLPEAVFAGLGNLERLRLQNNSLDALPADVFDGLSNLEELYLNRNSLDLLPAGLFAGLANLERLHLHRNSLDLLPVGVFDGLANLERLRLQNNSLDSLPDGAFVGLGNLEELNLNNNDGNDPFELRVELERLDAVAGSASCADSVLVRATLRHGAPARLGMPISANGATPSADTLVFAAGASASDTVAACASGRASMRFGPAPALPSGFLGLEVVPGDTLVLTANLAPELDAPIPDTLVAGGGATVTVDASGHFSDPDGDALTYAATSSNAQVATVSVAGSVVTVTVVGSGLTEVEVVASDAHESARDTFAVRVVPSVSFASDTASAPEGDTVRFGLVVSPAPASAFQLYYAVGADADPETADADAADHGATGVDSVLVAAGATGAGIGIAIADDATIEPTRERFVVTLGPPGPDTAYLPGPTAAATGTILEGVCDRTPGVRDGIVAAATAADCAAVDDGALAGVDTLDLGNAGVSAPRTGDFSGLSALTALHLNQNGIDSLPADVFVGLASLERLHLNNNSLASLPAGVFDGLASLERLHLNRNDLASLPTDAFDGLASLERLHLNNNSLASLPADAFDGLASLGRLHLNNNSLDSLPAGAFDGLASLWRLHLNNNSLASLPDGVFVGLDGLTRLDLGNNDGNDPFKLAVELERAGGGSCAAGANGVRVRATLRLGAPTRLAMPVSADGATTLSADTLVFAAGASASDTVTACWSGSGGASVWFGPAPALPAGFAGLVVEPGDTLALARNRAPEVDAPIADTVVAGGDAVTVDASEHFSDPDGDPLAYAATSSDALVATVAVAGSVVTVTPVGSGETDVEVVASDGPLSVADTFSVRFVPTVSFASGAASAPEGATLQLELVVSPAPASPLQVRYSVGADADPATADADAADHGAADVDSVLVAAGATSAEVGFAIADDAAIEPAREHFVVTLLGASGADSAYLPGPTATATGTILEGVCDRTPGVRDGIVAAATAADCAAVDDAALAGLGVLNLDDAGVAAPRTGDFSGLPGLTELHLRQNGIDSLPADVFVGLDSLERLFLNGNDLDSLPADAFDGLANLRRLYLNGNDLASLPTDLFDGLANLQWLFLNGNDLASLPADAFDGLANLQRLFLNGNDLASLPADLFDGLANLQRLFLQGNSLDSLPGGAFDDLASLQRLRLDNNDLDSLPDGVFVGLDGLTLLNLGGNPGAPFALAVELERLEGGGAGSCAAGANGALVRATLRLGAPARLGMPVSADGATTLSADTLVFAAGASASDTVTACWSGSGIASVWFGPAPALPSGFTGLVVVPGDTLDLDPNRAPEVSVPIPDTLVGASDTVTVDATGHFTDPDGDPLTYAATSLDALVATVSVAGNVVTVAAIAAGETSVEVVASDSSLSARDTFAVRVAPSVSFESATASAAEGETLLLELDVPSSASAFHVHYSVDVDADPATADADSADHGHGAAERDSVLVAAGATSASIGIAIADDATIEAAREHFVVTLEAPAGSDPAYLPGPTARATARIREGVCDRTPEVRDGIVAAVAAADCAAVDGADLAGLAVLDLGDEDISALRGRDLMGLSGLDTLDLADNDLTSLPAGLFEGVGSLARLDLGNQGGDPNSSITLQIAFERTDGPMTGSAPATLRMTLAEGAPTALNTRIQIVTGSWTTASDVFFDAGSVHSASANVGSDGVGQTTVNPSFQGLTTDTLTLPDFVGVAFKLPASITLF